MGGFSVGNMFGQIGGSLLGSGGSETKQDGITKYGNYHCSTRYCYQTIRFTH